MKSDFTLAFNEIIETRSLPREKVLEALSQALVSAYRRDAKVIDSQRVEADIDLTGKPRVLVEKEVVRHIISPQTEILLEDAQELDADIQEGELIMAPVELSKSFGRIAAQTAKQVILQHIREAERESLYEEYIERVDDIVIGTVQSLSGGTVTVDLGRPGAEAVMPPNHRIPNERYRPHDKIRVYVVEVKRSPRGPQIIVSRSHRNMLRRLMEFEVPEIYNGLVEIKNIAREAGQRSKVAVAALQEGIDAVGACVGMRGMRIQNIVRELNDEKIDIIEWNADPAKYIERALSPAKVDQVFLEDELDTVRTATVIVPENELSLAIGKEGQNARLAAKLTGWRIDIKSVIETATSALMNIHDEPLDVMKDSHPELVSEAFRILEKKEANRALTPEEYTTLSRFVKVSEGLLFRVRESVRKVRRDAIDAVRPLVPPASFSMPLKELELAPDIMDVISFMGNVGELWLRYMADERGLGEMLRQGGAADDAMEAIRDALDDLVLPEVYSEPEAAEAADAAETAPDEESITVAEAAEAPESTAGEPEATLPHGEFSTVEDAPVLEEDSLAEEISSFAELEPSPELVQPSPQVKDSSYDAYLDETVEEFTDFDEEPEGEVDMDAPATKEKKRSKKRAKQRRRQLVFDEEVGEVVAKRRRKREGGEADDYEEYF